LWLSKKLECIAVGDVDVEERAYSNFRFDIS
jgi:hypothetical protein